jgi:REP element-mobilizing transposase RayT
MTKGTSSYRIKLANALYFLTCTTVNWIDVFTRKKYADIIVDSLDFCQKEKGLELISWCIMSNHIHLVARAKKGFHLANIIRVMKKYTAKQIVKAIKESPESRKSWLIAEILKAGKLNSKKQTHQLWRNDNHPIELFKPATIQQKIKYIHFNPVKAGIVYFPEHYRLSSAKDYSGNKGLLDVVII